MDGSVYWIGQDGNIWLKNANGTFNQGPAANANPDSSGYTDPYGSLRLSATQIADPMVKTAAPAPAASGPVFNQAGADNTQKAIDQIGPLLQAALDSESTSHANTLGGFNAAETTQRGAYDTGTTTNQKNYDSNFMDSIRSGIQGLHGLFSLLRGTGAAGGTAEDTVRNTVGGVTSNDIRTGADTRDENQGQLDSSLGTFLSDLKQKRAAAEDTFANNNSAIRRDSNTQLQDLFGKMAGFYGDVGNTGKSNDWMNLAGNLTPEIAADSKTKVSPYDTTPVVVHAPNLTAFTPPTQPSITPAPSDGQVGSGIFTLGGNKRKTPTSTPTPSAVPVGV